jgi:hypothetical protein
MNCPVYSDPESLVLSAVQSCRKLSLNQAVTALPQLSWSELFHAVDSLSRRGAIVLKRHGFDYELRAT